MDLSRAGRVAKEITIAADCSIRTLGLFACGDVTKTLDKRKIIASGEGAKAALTARRYHLNLNTQSSGIL